MAPDADALSSAALGQFPSDEARLLRLRYGRDAPPRSMAAVAELLGVSLPDAERTHTRALQRLRGLSLRADDWPERDEV